MSGRLRRLAGQSITYTVGDLLNRAFSFLLIPLYTAYLSPTDYGVVAVASTIASVLGVLYLQSLEGALTRFHYDYADDSTRREYYGTIWILMMAFSLIASLLLEAAGPRLFGVALRDVTYIPYIRLVVWTTFLTNTTLLLYRALLRVQEKAVAFSVVNVGTFLLNTGMIAYLVVARGQGALGSLRGRFWATLLLAVPITVAYLRRARLAWSWPQARASLAFALPLIPHLLSLWVLNLSDRLVLQQFVPLADVGIYSLGYQMAAIVQLVAFSAMNAWGPFFYKTADQPGAPAVLSRYSTYYWLAVASVACAVSLLSKDVLAVMASRPAYHSAYRVVAWVALASMTRAFYFVFMTALYHTKRVRYVPLVTVLAGALNVGLNLALVPRFGYLVAAVTTLAAYLVQTIAMYFLAQRAYPMRYEFVRVLKMVAVGVGIYAVGAALPMSAGWGALLVKVGVLASYPIWLSCLGFWTGDEKAAFRRFTRQHLTRPDASRPGSME